MSAATWVAVIDRAPPEGVVVDSKIHDAQGVRNEQPLKRQGRLWFLPDGAMYVYYTPTHWRDRPPALSPEQAAAGGYPS